MIAVRLIKMMASCALLSAATITPALAQAPEPEHQFNQGFTLQGVAILVTIITSVAGLAFMIWMGMRKVRRENEADGRSRTDEIKREVGGKLDSYIKTTDDRLKAVETAISDFMPRSEIETRIEHARNNFKTVEQATLRKFETIDKGLSDLQVHVGRIDERHTGLSQEVAEVKLLIKEGARDTAARLDKIADQLTARAA